MHTLGQKKVGNINQEKKKLRSGEQKQKIVTSKTERDPITKNLEPKMGTESENKSESTDFKYDEQFIEVFEHDDDRIEEIMTKKIACDDLKIIEIIVIGPSKQHRMRYVIRKEQKLGTLMNGYCTSVLNRKRRDHVRFFFKNQEIRWCDTPKILNFEGNDVIHAQMKTEEEIEKLLVLKAKTAHDEEKERWQAWKEEIAEEKRKEKEMKKDHERKKKEKAEKVEKDQKAKQEGKTSDEDALGKESGDISPSLSDEGFFF